MKVKELKKLLNKFDDNHEVCVGQIYNSTGGIRDIDCVRKSKYEKETVVLEPKY